LADTVPDRLYGPGQQLASYHLQTFGVLPEHQKKGYGMALMTAVEEKVFYSNFPCTFHSY
jgi:GNAT superfamily N-acetyltransferase